MFPRAVPLLSNATLPDGSLVDVEIEGGIVTAIRPAGSSTPRTESVDLTGYLLLTAPAEPHAHLDTVPGAGSTGREQEQGEDEIAARARDAALTMLRNGTTAIRTHVALLPHADPLRGVRALTEVRDALAPLIDLQIVAVVGTDTDEQVVDSAVDLGVDLIGGAPHLALEPIAELHRLVAIARRRRLGLDLHTDESHDGQVTLPEYARLVRGWPGTVSAGNCARLWSLDDDDLTEVIGEVLASDMGIVVLPLTEVVPEASEHPDARAPDLLPVRALLDRGVRVAAGADDLRDPASPAEDALGTASWLMTAGRLTFDEAYTAVSAAARSVMGLPLAGVSVGEQAEFLAIRAHGLADALTDASADRVVIHRGRMVAGSVESTATSSGALLSAG